MEVITRKTIKHKSYTLKEKNEIVKEYLDGKAGKSELIRKYDISSSSVIHRWITQYCEFGTTKDKRGKSSQKGIGGRNKKMIPEEMTPIQYRLQFS